MDVTKEKNLNGVAAYSIISYLEKDIDNRVIHLRYLLNSSTIKREKTSPLTTMARKNKKEKFLEIMQILRTISFSEVEKMPSELLDSLMELSDNLSLDESQKLENEINRCNMAAYHKVYDEVEDKLNKALALAKKADGDHYSVGVNLFNEGFYPTGDEAKDRRNYYKDHPTDQRHPLNYTNYVECLEYLQKRLQQELKREYVDLRSNGKKDYSVKDFIPMAVLDSIKHGRVKVSDECSKVAKHYEEIKMALQNKNRLEQKISALEKSIEVVKKYSQKEQSYDAILKNLLNLQKNALKELKDIEKYLSKYNLEMVYAEVNSLNTEILNQNEQTMTKNAIVEATYKLEQAQVSGNWDLIRKCEAELKALITNSGLSNYETEEAYTMGVQKYQDEQMMKAEIAYERKLESDALKQLRPEEYDMLRAQAIKELELNGGYKPDHVERSLDVYDNDSYEAAIQRKMEELASGELSSGGMRR